MQCFNIILCQFPITAIGTCITHKHGSVHTIEKLGETKLAAVSMINDSGKNQNNNFVYKSHTQTHTAREVNAVHVCFLYNKNRNSIQGSINTLINTHYK